MVSPFSFLHRGPAGGYGPGFTPITRAGDSLGAGPALGMDFGICRLNSGENLQEAHPDETAWVLLRGEAAVSCECHRYTFSRRSVFDEGPSCFHVPANTGVVVTAGTQGAEWVVVRTANPQAFTPRAFYPSDVVPEFRGAGLVQNASLRNVRLIFDRAQRPASNLVMGEVVNFPGRWSSYPPHHHDQPEIYHYRFTETDGYGHAELGDEVVKVREGDTVVIPPGRDHAQVSAPGYGMYYLWAIRHLPGNPYTGFTFTEEHRWTLDPARQGWRPPDLPQGLV
jgi:5-deoxy-glucuronate isomerase